MILAIFGPETKGIPIVLFIVKITNILCFQLYSKNLKISNCTLNGGEGRGGGLGKLGYN